MASELSKLIEDELKNKGYYVEQGEDEEAPHQISEHQALMGALRVEARVKEQNAAKHVLGLKRAFCIGGGIAVVCVVWIVLVIKSSMSTGGGGSFITMPTPASVLAPPPQPDINLAPPPAASSPAQHLPPVAEPSPTLALPAGGGQVQGPGQPSPPVPETAAAPPSPPVAVPPPGTASDVGLDVEKYEDYMNLNPDEGQGPGGGDNENGP